MRAKQAAILAYIIQYLDKHKTPPTLAELASAFGYSSPNAPGYQVAVLQSRGYLTPYQGHSYHVTDEGRAALRRYLSGETAGIMRDSRKCSIEGCNRKHRCRGFCLVHYQRWRRGADMALPIEPKPRQGSRCPLCGVKAYRRGYCEMHYMRWRKYGDPRIVRGLQVEP